MFILLILSIIMMVFFGTVGVVTVQEWVPFLELNHINFSLAFLFGFSLLRLLHSKQKKLMSKVSKMSSFTSINWREFEFLTGEYYRSKGYTVKVIGGTGGDGGIDLIIKKSFKKTIVQCKHWKGSIGVSIVREMFGVMHAENADSVIIVCSNKFTKEALKFAKGKPIELIDGHTFLKRIKEQ